MHGDFSIQNLEISRTTPFPMIDTHVSIIFTFLKDLQTVTEAHIDIQSISDHAPIYLRVDLYSTLPRPNTWRLNTSLLTDPELLPRIRTAISDFFITNTPDMDLMIWEAHKCTIRGGELIKMGAQRKKRQEKEICDLADKILRLETTHKQSLAAQSARELLDTRKTLQQLFETKTKRSLFFFFFFLKSTMSQETRRVGFWPGL